CPENNCVPKRTPFFFIVRSKLICRSYGDSTFYIRPMKIVAFGTRSLSLSFWSMRERVGRKIRPSSLSFTRPAGILLILTLMMIPSLAQVSGTKPPPSPPPSTSTTWAKAYNIPYDYAVAYSVSQLSSGGYVVGASCTAAAVTTPNCNTLSEPTAIVMRVDSGGNIQSQTQYNYLNYPYSTALDRSEEHTSEL